MAAIDLKTLVREVPDFPEPGVGFKDISSLLLDATALRQAVEELAGWTRERSLRKADEIYDTLLGVFELAREQGIPTYVAADRLAERRLKAVGALVRTWPPFPREE